MNKKLCEFEELFLDYQIWFIIADKSEDGWQSDYPRWNALLVTSHYPSVRWQIYSVLGENSAYESIELLKEGIKDTDSYYRRRALLSLAKLKPKGMQQIIRPLLNDQGAYIHQIVSGLLNVG